MFAPLLLGLLGAASAYCGPDANLSDLVYLRQYGVRTVSSASLLFEMQRCAGQPMLVRHVTVDGALALELGRGMPSSVEFDEVTFRQPLVLRGLAGGPAALELTRVKAPALSVTDLDVALKDVDVERVWLTGERTSPTLEATFSRLGTVTLKGRHVRGMDLGGGSVGRLVLYADTLEWLRLVGVAVGEDVDLEGRTLAEVVLDRSVIQGSVFAGQAALGTLSAEATSMGGLWLVAATVGRPPGSCGVEALNLRRFRGTVLGMNGTQVLGDVEASHAVLAAGVELDHARLACSAQWAGARVEGTLSAVGTRFGALGLADAHVGAGMVLEPSAAGTLDLTGATTPRLVLDGSHVAVVLATDLHATRLVLRGKALPGGLDLRGVRPELLEWQVPAEELARVVLDPADAERLQEVLSGASRPVVRKVLRGLQYREDMVLTRPQRWVWWLGENAAWVFGFLVVVVAAILRWRAQPPVPH